ncbi:RNase H domain-containing protein [Trichonephila clavipes]|nr:RNase H domain-containing protein [Trichonephila clavipes]
MMEDLVAQPVIFELIKKRGRKNEKEFIPGRKVRGRALIGWRDGGISGSGVYILTPTRVMDINIKNSNFCSVFRSELIVTRRGLQSACETEVQFQDVWILTDGRSSLQHLFNWTSIGEQTSLDILNLLGRISSNNHIHFQWVPSHVGLMIELPHFGRTLPSDPWDFGRNPGGSFKQREELNSGATRVEELTLFFPLDFNERDAQICEILSCTLAKMYEEVTNQMTLPQQSCFPRKKNRESRTYIEFIPE